MKRLVCPYHQWTYNLDGGLIRTRHMDGAIDKTLFGLKSVHCESVAGYIFVCVAPAAPSFEPFRAQAERYLSPHNIANAKIAFESTIVENGNWKLVWENNRECYHCAANHPELCRTFPEKPTISGIDSVADDLEINAHWDSMRGGWAAQRLRALRIRGSSAAPEFRFSAKRSASPCPGARPSLAR